MSGATVDSGRGTTLWTVERWDAEMAAWAQQRRARHLSERMILARPEPVQADFRALRIKPYSVTQTLGNVITNAGWQALLKAATSGASGPLIFSSTVGRLGVGDTAGTPAAADTDLAASAGSTHRLYKFMAAAPTVGTTTNRTWTFVATFGSSDFNQVWAEFGIDSGTADGTTVVAPLLNHANSAQGTKTAGQVWTSTAILSFT
jgi:hypothetical protein